MIIGNKLLFPIWERFCTSFVLLTNAPLLPLPVAKSDPRAAAVLVDEFDAGFFECSPDYIQGRAPGLTNSRLELMHRHDANVRLTGEILLAPIN